MAVVIDDRLRLDVLAGQPPGEVTAELGSGGVSITSAWHYRLGRAVFGGSSSGALSGRLASLGGDLAERVRAQLVELPPNVGGCTLGSWSLSCSPSGAATIERPRRRGPGRSRSPATPSPPARHDRPSLAALGSRRHRHRHHVLA